MQVLPISEARANLKAVVDHVIEDSEPVILSRQGGKAVVLVSLDDWNSIEETLHLMSTPANATRLRKAIRDLEAGGGEEHDLLQP
ncbi:antitoxin YefM [Novosphingobium chloroacetimidivorans]|uniref:Antitoxin n=1 Tax=Novosphingobium chloroacetimidivorans TaxID=1428314 RepID=A0A7W7NWL4_9SPHN|nr:type II toxin-antitoxin system prevent-host-death family antitoxin [Novosphingobium chloroacetimidivorans]MBB4859703.1 antitoxin YefM [Novosphingobium chloroacetimidivorans]